MPSARGAWSEYSLRYGRRPEVTSLLPSYVANRYRPSSDSARVGWLPGRVPVWLLGPRAHRVAEMGRDVAEVRKAMEGAGAAGRAASAPDPSREPRPIAADELLALLERDRCVVVEIHEYAAEPGMPGVRGSVRLPHPACTEAFPGWEDEETVVIVVIVLMMIVIIVLIIQTTNNSDSGNNNHNNNNDNNNRRWSPWWRA